MLISLENSSPVPIYEQIVSGVIFTVAAGDLEAGARIPSVRELAVQLRVNPNTVARAYQDLEREGVITARRGLGMEVTPEARSLCRKRRQAIVRERIRSALREAVASALPADELRALVEEELNHVNGHAGRRDGKGAK
jgi:GntR family transcriptional regulator